MWQAASTSRSYLLICLYAISLSSLGGISYPGIYSLWVRDHSFGFWVYKDFAFEYPFMSGAFMQLVNFAGALTPRTPDATVLFFSSLGMGVFAALCLFIMWRMDVDPKKALIFFLFAPVVVMQFDLSFELEQMFFFLLGLYFFQKQKESSSSFVLALSAGTKLLPLATFPIFLQRSANRLRFSLIYIGTFVSGMVIQYLISPLNFFRWIHFHESYGIEGSWLGFFFQQQVINYSNKQTWNIGNGTTVSLPPLYIIVSICLLLASLVFVYRLKNVGLVEKCFLAFACDSLFLWISAPQFLINVAALTPLVIKDKVALNPRFVKKVLSFQGMNLFAVPPLAAYLYITFGWWSFPIRTFWITIATISFVFLAIMIFFTMKNDIFAPQAKEEQEKQKKTESFASCTQAS
jgi:hypothetical protein